MTGVIGHITNPTPTDAVELATAAEAAGARWLGLADAFWWRDVWMLLSDAARATDGIEIGPAMTNAYLRHPFHTVSALATLHELAPGRVFCGITAGGSEVSAAAGIPRTDASTRVAALAALIRGVMAGEPLDQTSGRHLDLALPATPILMAGRGDAMLRRCGGTADRVLLWAIPNSDLARSVELVLEGAAERPAPPELIWAPLVQHRNVDPAALGHVAVYAALNTNEIVRNEWGLDAPAVASIRQTLVAGGTGAAIEQVPQAAMDDLVLAPDNAPAIAEQARRLGVTEIAVPGFGAGVVGSHLRWARAVEIALHEPPP